MEGKEKIKKVFIISLLFVIFFLVGCKRTNDIENLNIILSKYHGTSDINLSYTYKIKMLEMTTTVRSKVVAKKVGEEVRAFVEAEDDSNTVATYYIGNYLCMEDSGQILVAEVPGFDYDEEVPIPEFDFDEFEYDYLKTENNEVVVHTFTVKDEAVLGALEGIIPDYGTVSRFEMELIFIIDKAKEELRNMNMYITMLFQNLKIDMEMLMKINHFGSDVELEIPSKFTEAIAEYKKSKQEDSEPNDSEPVNYKDTEDGVVDYHNLSYHKKIVYDGLTDKLAVLRNRKIDIYDAETMELEIEINVGQYPKYIDADQGSSAMGRTKLMFMI